MSDTYQKHDVKPPLPALTRELSVLEPQRVIRVVFDSLQLRQTPSVGWMSWIRYAVWDQR